LDTPENLKKEIGEGDVLEITLSDSKMNQEVIMTLKEIEYVISVVEVDRKINLRGLNALSKLPQLLENIEKKGVRIADLSMRQNTLEDVFIDLTGTSLRD